MTKVQPQHPLTEQLKLRISPQTDARLNSLVVKFSLEDRSVLARAALEAALEALDSVEKLVLPLVLIPADVVTPNPAAVEAEAARRKRK